MSTSSTTTLFDARGQVQGFIVKGSSGITAMDTKGHYTGFIDKDGTTRDARMNVVSFQPRFDLILPARSNVRK